MQGRATPSSPQISLIEELEPPRSRRNRKLNSALISALSHLCGPHVAPKAAVKSEILGKLAPRAGLRTSDPAVNSRLLYQLSYRGAERAHVKRRYDLVDSKRQEGFPELCASPRNWQPARRRRGLRRRRIALMSDLRHATSPSAEDGPQSPPVQSPLAPAAVEAGPHRARHSAHRRRPARLLARARLLDDPARASRAVGRSACSAALAPPAHRVVASPQRRDGRRREGVEREGRLSGATRAGAVGALRRPRGARRGVGGHDRNRTGVHGFAVHAATPPHQWVSCKPRHLGGSKHQWVRYDLQTSRRRLSLHGGA